ncbi:MAG: LysR family transcriptional regulator [Rhizobiaceae bacterium]
MNLKQLRHFQLVAEELNYHQAAERAHLSQPAMSHSIKALESQLGEKLFDRSSRAVKLTPFGDGVLEHANKLLFEASNFETGVKNLQLGTAGHISIGMSTTIAENFGGRAMVAFSKIQPKVSFEVSVFNSNHILNRLSDELDHFAICDAQTAVARNDLTTEAWGEQLGGFFCRPGHPILQLSKPTFELAHSFGFTSFNVTPSISRQLEARLGIDGATVPLLKIAADNLKICRDISLATDHILIAELDNVRADVNAGELITLDLGFGFRRNLCIATKISRALPKTATEMTSFLIENQKQFTTV